MKKRTSLALAAAVLLSGITAASAATMSNPAKASDTLSLSSAQRKTAWNDLYVSWLNSENALGIFRRHWRCGPEQRDDGAGSEQSRPRGSVAQALRLRPVTEEARDCESVRQEDRRGDHEIAAGTRLSGRKTQKELAV